MFKTNQARSPGQKLGLLTFVVMAALLAFCFPSGVMAQEATPDHVAAISPSLDTDTLITATINNVSVDTPPVNQATKKHRRHRQTATSRNSVTATQWKKQYGWAVVKAANYYGVPPNLLMAVIATESGYRAYVTGSNGEIGLSQLKLNTARSVGYSGTRKALYDPVTNIFTGAKYLSIAYKKSGGNICRAASLYNQGLYSKRVNVTYCSKVQRAMGRPSNRIV